MASPGGWVRCRVMRAGPADDSKIYIRLAEKQGAWERWFSAIEAFEKEMLATALTAISTGNEVEVLLETLDEYGRIMRLYVTNERWKPPPPPPPPRTTVPDVRESLVIDAVREIEEVGLVARVSGPTTSGAWVYSQSPAGGAVVDVGSTVQLTSRTGPRP
jgi:PASTA domain